MSLEKICEKSVPLLPNLFFFGVGSCYFSFVIFSFNLLQLKYKCDVSSLVIPNIFKNWIRIFRRYVLEFSILQN